MALTDEILELARVERGSLSPWFERRLQAAVEDGTFLPDDELEAVTGRLTDDLADYRRNGGVSTAVLGMSGGVDSALTAALLKRAGWRVVGFTLPIEQDPEETERGREACAELGLEHHHLDLSDQYRSTVAGLGGLDAALPEADDAAHRTRRGNVRARLRMITLYDQAHRFGGLVASTDNWSELAAGFWTLHGDVGDLAPIQSLLKSWEVPWMARATGVPERTWRAKPTDGLGIGGGDEAQIGARYLEWDLTVLAIAEALVQHPGLAADELAEALEIGSDERARAVLDTALKRLRMTWHKRVNPIRLDHPKAERYEALDTLDARLFRPTVLRPDQAVTSFAGEVPVLAGKLADALKQSGLTLVTAESCTAGLLAAAVSDAPGSSRVLEGSFVTYRASMKENALGVPGELIERETPYHPEVARRMAAGALERAPSAGVALSITGVAGPGPDEGKPAGLVYLGAAMRGAPPIAEEHRIEGRPRQVLAEVLCRALKLGLRVVEGAGADRAAAAAD